MIIKKIDNFLDILNEPSNIAIGFFDGLHLGHQKIIEALLKDKLNNKIVITFSDSLIKKIKKAEPINTFKQRCKYFKRNGVDYLFYFDTKSDLLKYKALDFINYLKDRFNLNNLIVGEDFKLGTDHQNIFELNIKDINIIKIKDVYYHNNKVTSTYIRELLKQGNIKLANELMYEPFTFEGKVKHGNQIGTQLGFKTINLSKQINANNLRFGVYFGYAFIDKQIYKAMINIGVNPTVSNDNKLHIEAHLLDFNQDAYNKHVEVNLLYFYRDEIKFDSLDALKEQLEIDANKLTKWPL